METGINLPVMAPGLTRDRLFEWIDIAEHSSLSHIACGERITFYNPELVTLLSAIAATTRRIRIAAYVMVLPLHSAVLAAKQLATIDMISNGRLTVGLGVGGREEDYRALDVSLERKRLAVLASQVDVMRRIWRGEQVVEGALMPVEPLPVQPGGPRLLAGAIGPKAVASAAPWAEGLCGFSFGPDYPSITQLFAQADQCWREAGHAQPPFKGTGFWFSMGGKEQMVDYLGRYLNFIPVEYRDSMIRMNTVTGAAELKEALQRCRDLGADEVSLVPTTSDPEELKRLLDIL